MTQVSALEKKLALSSHDALTKAQAEVGQYAARVRHLEGELAQLMEARAADKAAALAASSVAQLTLIEREAALVSQASRHLTHGLLPSSSAVTWHQCCARQDGCSGASR